MTGEVSICKQSAGEVTQALHDIASKGTVNLNIWSFDKVVIWQVLKYMTFIQISWNE